MPRTRKRRRSGESENESAKVNMKKDSSSRLSLSKATKKKKVSKKGGRKKKVKNSAKGLDLDEEENKTFDSRRTRRISNGECGAGSLLHVTPASESEEEDEHIEIADPEIDTDWEEMKGLLENVAFLLDSKSKEDKKNSKKSKRKKKEKLSVEEQLENLEEKYNELLQVRQTDTEKLLAVAEKKIKKLISSLEEVKAKKKMTDSTSQTMMEQSKHSKHEKNESDLQREMSMLRLLTGMSVVVDPENKNKFICTAICRKRGRGCRFAIVKGDTNEDDELEFVPRANSYLLPGYMQEPIAFASIDAPAVHGEVMRALRWEKDDEEL